MNAGGSRKEFNQEYRNAKKSLRESGMSARDARRTARADIYMHRVSWIPAYKIF